MRFSFKNLRITYIALVESVLRYCITAWGGSYHNVLRNLEVIQNGILKIIFKKNYLYPTDMLYSELKLLSIRRLYTYQCLLWICEKGYSTANIVQHEHNTRWQQKESMIAPFYRKSHAQRFIFYIGPKLYNMLPAELKLLKGRPSLRKRLRQYVDENYDEIKRLYRD